MIMINDKEFFDTLVNNEYDFYGIDNNVFCIGVDGSHCAFEVLEDESDGYRSYFNTIKVSMERHIFFHAPIARIILERALAHGDEIYYRRKLFDGWQLRDVNDNHIWLIFGTDNSDDYYPNFVFDYSPKKIKEFPES